MRVCVCEFVCCGLCVCAMTWRESQSCSAALACTAAQRVRIVAHAQCGLEVTCEAASDMNLNTGGGRAGCRKWAGGAAVSCTRARALSWWLRKKPQLLRGVNHSKDV